MFISFMLNKSTGESTLVVGLGAMDIFQLIHDGQATLELGPEAAALMGEGLRKVQFYCAHTTDIIKDAIPSLYPGRGQEPVDQPDGTKLWVRPEDDKAKD